MKGPTAVLASGGLDSCVLLADLAKKRPVFPLYIRAGLVWEDEEHQALESFIKALNNCNVKPITTLKLPVQPLYANHWSVTGKEMPRDQDSDSKTFLPGRNVLLFSLAAVWCSLNGVHQIAIGTLRGNTFSDATPDFFSQMGKSLSTGLSFEVAIEAPYREVEKEDLIRKFASLPLEYSMTCMEPIGGVHCGRCAKCRQRKDGFKIASVVDRTRYRT